MSQRYCYDYPRPAVATDSAVFKIIDGDINILLIERGNPPYQGCWALPGGFLEMDEDAASGARRELKEETGISGVAIEQLHTFTRVDRDPRGRMISIVYSGWVTEKDETPNANDDAAKAQWFAITDLPPLAFDHDEIIAMAVNKLRDQHPSLRIPPV